MKQVHKIRHYGADGDQIEHEAAKHVCGEKASSLWGCTRCSAAIRPGDMILPLYSPLRRLHLKSWVWLWTPQHNRGIGHTGVSCVKMMKGLEHLSCEEMPREVGLSILAQVLPYHGVQIFGGNRKNDRVRIDLVVPSDRKEAMDTN